MRFLRRRIRRHCLAAALPLMALGVAAPSARAQEGASDAASRSSSAKLRPGDQIALNFLRDRELNSTVTVNEKGEAVFPKLGLFQVSDMTIAHLQDTLRSRYLEYLRAPEFEIAVLRRVVVNGEVRGPNVYLVDASTTLRELIARAGGLLETGSRSRVWIIRGDQKMPAKDWDKESGGSYTLVSGDQVLVGRKNWFVINAFSTVSTAVLVASLLISITR